jgi:signal recognition particle receptor subunit beta
MEGPERGTTTKKANPRAHVLICGPSGSGKTALINMLGTREWRETVSSLDHTRAQISLSCKVSADTTDDESVTKSIKLKFIDSPGHEHFLEETLDFAEEASAVILLIDSKDREAFGQAVEIIYELLNSVRTIVEDKIPVLIVCNKQDSKSAKRATELETDLEKELNELKRIKAATKDPEKQFVGYIERQKGRFEFRHLSDILQIVEASVKGGLEGDDSRMNLSEVVKFIVKKHAK